MYSGITKIKDRYQRRLGANNTGSVLVMAVVFSLAAMALGAAFLQYADHQRREISYDILMYKAYTGAHAALVRGMAVYTGSGVDYDDPIINLYTDDYNEFNVDYNYKTQDGVENQVGFVSETNFLIAGISYVTSYEFDGVFGDTAWHDMSKRSYADYLYITARETQSYRPTVDCTLYFWGEDTLDGKVHTNDIFSFEADEQGAWPVFEQEVTCDTPYFNPEDAENYVHFAIDPDPGDRYLRFPIAADSVRVHNGYKNPNLGVSVANQDDSVTEIILQPTYFLVRHRAIRDARGGRRYSNYPINPDSGAGNYDLTLLQADQTRYAYPTSGALFIEGELWLVGPSGNTHFNCTHPEESSDFTVYGFGGGELTIAASRDIVIAQNLEYADNNSDGTVPTTSPNVLGILSEEHIVIWRNAPTNSIKINAGLGAIGIGMDEDSVATSRRCGGTYPIIPVEGTNGTIAVDGVNCYGWDHNKDELFIVGCLIMRERGLVHSHYTNGGIYPQEDRGYEDKNYTYDTRFKYNPPPHFFEVESSRNYYGEEIPGEW